MIKFGREKAIEDLYREWFGDQCPMRLLLSLHHSLGCDKNSSMPRENHRRLGEALQFKNNELHVVALLPWSQAKKLPPAPMTEAHFSALKAFFYGELREYCPFTGSYHQHGEDGAIQFSDGTGLALSQDGWDLVMKEISK